MSAQWRSSSKRTSGWLPAISIRARSTASYRRNRSCSGSRPSGAGLGRTGAVFFRYQGGARSSAQAMAVDSRSPDGLACEVLAKGFDERHVRQRQFLVAAAEEDACTFGVRGPCKLRRQTCLANPRLAREQDELALAGFRLRPGVAEGSEGRVAPDERRAFAAEERCGQGQCLGTFFDCRFPVHFAGENGFGEALQGEGAEVGELERASGTDQAARKVGGDNLTTVGAVAETLGDNNRSPEVVLLVPDRLADMEADADMKRSLRLALVVAMHALLHRDRGGEGVQGAGEDDHQAIAQALHFLAAMAGDGLTKKPEVRAVEYFGSVIAETVEQLGGADQVGKEQRDDTRRFGHGPSIIAIAS